MAIFYNIIKMGCANSKGGKDMAITTEDLQEIEYRRRNTSLLDNRNSNSDPTKTNGNGKLSKKEKEDLLKKMQKEREESQRLQADLDAKIKAVVEDQEEESKSLNNSKSQGPGSKQIASSSIKKKQQSQDEDEDEDFKALKKAAAENVENNKKLPQSSSQQDIVNPNTIQLEINNKPPNIKPPPVCTGYMSKQG